MKNRLKKALSNLGLIDKARLYYNSAKSLSTRVLTDELKFRKNGLPDGFPSPPPNLIFLIIALRWSHIYYYSGKQIYEGIIQLLQKNRITLQSLNKILDFGCGCGRIIRHFHSNDKSVQLYGTDYNRTLVEWCSQNLTFGNFTVNMLNPPLEFAQETFNFIYARSVFTHMSFELQKVWIEEFKRLLKSGGYVYITTHGEPLFTNLNDNEISMIKSEGFLVINDEIEGDNKCTTYQTKEFFIKNLSDGFELTDFIPGRPGSASPQDIYLLKKI
ncbi:MAG: class I SAM-dependent methyltransferase [Bacteroidota bacterium]